MIPINDVLKALECCSGEDCRCPECPFYSGSDPDLPMCGYSLPKAALEAVKHLKEENERLQVEINQYERK